MTEVEKYFETKRRIESALIFASEAEKTALPIEELISMLYMDLKEVMEFILKKE